MEEAAEGLVKGILRFIRFILIELFCETLAYCIGRMSLKVVTFGKYPPIPETKKDRDRVIITGVLVTILTILVITILV